MSRFKLVGKGVDGDMVANYLQVYKNGITSLNLDELLISITSSPLPEPPLLFTSLRELFASWFLLLYCFRFHRYITMYRSAAALSFASVVLGQQGKPLIICHYMETLRPILMLNSWHQHA